MKPPALQRAASPPAQVHAPLADKRTTHDIEGGDDDAREADNEDDNEDDDADARSNNGDLDDDLDDDLDEFDDIALPLPYTSGTGAPRTPPRERRSDTSTPSTVVQESQRASRPPSPRQPHGGMLCTYTYTNKHVHIGTSL